ncbi:hypothetical protein NW765_000127 [Fusarium oxysporum]|nr:hypothetical protein NW765_000127 [Fusarium oxysporum]KAJ4267876.1 hypothetical protein NW764_014868 [Fusarium oxysporum]
MSYKSVVLLGASGNLGKLTLQTFLDSDLSVTAVIRTTSQATFPEGINVVKSDFNVESLSKVFEGQDAVISLFPILSLEAQAIAIEAAIAAGVKRFIPSEYGSDSTNPDVIAAVPFFEAKKKYLDYLKSREDAISWTGLITGPFFDWGLPMGIWGFDLINKKAQLFDGGNTKFTASNGAQVGRALVAILANPAKTANKLVSVESFTTTQSEVLAVLEKATGTEWARTEIPVEEVRAEAFKLLSEGDVANGGAKAIASVVFGKEALEDHTHLGTAQWNKELGLPSETVEATVQRVLKSLE